MEARASAFQLTPQLAVVIDLAVEDKCVTPIGGGHGLLPGGQVNNAQPPVAQGHARARIIALTVRTAVRETPSHRHDDFRLTLSNYSGKAAHVWGCVRSLRLTGQILSSVLGDGKVAWRRCSSSHQYRQHPGVQQKMWDTLSGKGGLSSPRTLASNLSVPKMSEIGIVLSDSATLLCIFNNLVALFFTKKCVRMPRSRISNLVFPGCRAARAVGRAGSLSRDTSNPC